MSETIRSASAGPALRSVAEVRSFATLRAISALILREMIATYGKSPLGYLWAIFEPVGGIALLTLIFSIGFKSPPLGTSFPVFYATGLVPFLMYNDISNKMMNSLIFSRSLLMYPRVTVVDAVMARFILNALTQVLVAYFVLAGILIFTDHRTDPNIPQAALGILMAISLGVGVGTLNCFLAGLMPSYPRIWAIFNRPMFLISGVIILYDTIPDPYRSVLWYNPLVHVMGQMRTAFYPYYEADYVSHGYLFGFAAITLLLGLVFLRRYARWILQVN